MKTLHTNTATYYNTISITQVIMDASNYLTFWGQLQTEAGWVDCDFVANYDVLNQMLRHQAPQSDQLQMIIVEKLEDMRQRPDQIPEIIDLETILGGPLTFHKMTFQLSRPRVKQQGTWVEYTGERCYYIQQIMPLAAPAPTPKAAYTQQIDHAITLLSQRYALYLGYLEIEFDEVAAREEAGLQDDHKYTMAYCAWKQQAA
ncbi:hypothetical protein GA0116948_1223 [Chitinophaga costaii]|uniref:Uncharacterized protein n=1 Tax=Chitinophaga costaii TaxID=1335309 RepID=A0A1C4G3V7_9BACT|nr:hypothetical protein [Chitinophaga costaii]PUZ22037.1 hypothetical protein DCM91_15010 [Chitinophaga costaii]SCC62898.1 hypothetical protein GA0116948_1223 [Chitinophaga costaii]